MNNVIKKNDLIESDIKIENMIYEIRGVQVMLDSDLALLYECANGTKSINLAVKRHSNKFPERYMFKLNNEESKIIWFQIETKYGKLETRGGKYSNPYVFTESGVAMLATVLRTKVAEEISIKIMDAFVAMRHHLINNKDIYQSLTNINNKLIYHENLLLNHNEKFNEIFSKFDKKEQLFISGQTYDAYSCLLTIFKYAKKELIIIDSYADNTVLDMIRKLNCRVILITKNSDRLNETDITKYNSQYNNLVVIRNNSFHDRYFIVERKNIYHSGTSINNAGTKTFSINKLEDIIIIETLLKKVEDIIKE